MGEPGQKMTFGGLFQLNGAHHELGKDQRTNFATISLEEPIQLQYNSVPVIPLCRFNRRIIIELRGRCTADVPLYRPPKPLAVYPVEYDHEECFVLFYVGCSTLFD